MEATVKRLQQTHEKDRQSWESERKRLMGTRNNAEARVRALECEVHSTNLEFDRVKRLKTLKKPDHHQLEEGNLFQGLGSPRGSPVVGFRDDVATYLRGAALERRERLTQARTALSNNNKLLGALSQPLLGEESVKSIDKVRSKYSTQSLKIGQHVPSPASRGKTHDDE